MKQSTLQKKGWDFAYLPAAVFLSADLTHADVTLYSYLLWRQGRNDRSWPKVTTMADDLHMSEQAVRLSLKNLVKNDWIRRERNYGHSSDTYIFESQELCRKFDPRSANRREDDPLTGERMIRQQASRLNETHRTRIIERRYPLTLEGDITSPLDEPDEPKRVDPGDEFEDGAGKHILPKTPIELRLANATGRQYIEGFKQKIAKVEGMLKRGEMTEGWLADRIEKGHKYSWSLRVLLSSLLNTGKMQAWAVYKGRSLSGMWEKTGSDETNDDDLRKFAGLA